MLRGVLISTHISMHKHKLVNPIFYALLINKGPALLFLLGPWWCIHRLVKVIQRWWHETGLLQSLVFCSDRKRRRKSSWSAACASCPSWAWGVTSIRLHWSWTRETSTSSVTCSGASPTREAFPRPCSRPVWWVTPIHLTCLLLQLKYEL